MIKNKLYCLIALACGLFTLESTAQVVATQSGNWSSNATWGGQDMNSALNKLKDIDIPIGITVTCDVDISLNFARTLNVQGTLNASGKTLDLNAGDLVVKGNLVVDSLRSGTGGSIDLGPAANLACNTFTAVASIIDIDSGNFAVNEAIYLTAGLLRIKDAAQLTLSDSCWLKFLGGNIKNLSSNPVIGKLNLSFDINVDTLFNKLGGASLNRVSFDFNDPSKTITLGESLAIDGSLNLKSGLLDLAGNKLTVNGDLHITGGKLKGATNSVLAIMGSGALDTLIFETNYGLLDSLTVNRNTRLNLGSDLFVAGLLKLQGSDISIGENVLSLAGNLALDSALIIGGNKAGLKFSGSGVFDTLKFDPSGKVLEVLEVSVDSLKQVILGNDVEIKGTLFTTSGEVVLSGDTLTISGSISSDKGLLVGTAGASIVITGVDTAGRLDFKPGFDTIQSLTLNRMPGDTVGMIKLGSNLILTGDLNLVNGALTAVPQKTGNKKDQVVLGSSDIIFSVYGKMNLQSAQISDVYVPGVAPLGKGDGYKGLQVNVLGGLSTTEESVFASNGTMNLVIEGGLPVDTLVFDEVYNKIKKLIYMAGTDLVLGSDLKVEDSLAISGSNISINNNTLIIAGDLTLDSAVILGGDSARMIISGAGEVDDLVFHQAAAVLNDLEIRTDSANTITIATNLTVNGQIYVASGELDIEGDTLTVTGTIETEDGTLAADSSVTIVIVSDADTAAAIAFSEEADTVGSIIIARTSGKKGSNTVAKIKSDLIVNQALQLTDATLSMVAFEFGSQPKKGGISTNTLVIMNDLITDNSTIAVDEYTELIIEGMGEIDTLTFDEMYDTLNTLIYTANDELVINSDLTVTQTIEIVNTTIVIANSTLTIQGDLVLDNAQLSVDELTNLILMGSGDIDTLTFDPDNSSLNELTINFDTATKTVVLDANVTINGYLVLVSGELVLSKDTITLNGTASNEDGTITGNASATLVIGGSDSTVVALKFTEGKEQLKSLVIDNPAMAQYGGGLLLESTLVVDSLLVLANGYINIESYDLVLDSLAAIEGYSDMAYVITGGTGKLVQYVTMADTAITFPVGTSSQYAPATIKLKADSLTGVYAVNVNEGVYTDGVSGDNLADSVAVVAMTWNFESDQDTVNAEISVQWTDAQEVNGFNHDSCFISHYENGAWDSDEAVAATEMEPGVYQVSRDSITSFSPFTVTSEDIVTRVKKANLSGSRFVIYPNPATDQLYVAGASELQHVELYDVVGNLVLSGQLQEGLNRLNVAALSKGLYLIHLKGTDRKISTSKLIINK